MSAPEATTVPEVAPVEEVPAVAEPAVAEPAVAEPVEETPAVAVAEDAPAAATAPVEETVPAVEGEAPVAEPTAETAVATTEEETVAEPAKAIESGVLGYKAPGLIKGFKFSKKHFWLGEEPISHDKLSSYLRGEKPEIAHPTAAWSSQTGKGLLYFSKHAEEKATPAGILNLAEASDLEKQSPHEFYFKLHGHKHAFKAADDAERDGWFVAIEKAITEAKASKEDIVSGEGYKESLASLSKPAAVAGGAAVAATGARKSTDAPKIEEPARADSTSSTDEEAAKKKKNESRSVSRGKRTSMFGNLLNKKENHDAKKEVKKEEKEEAKEEAKVEKEEAETEEPAKVEETEPVVAPLDAEAVAARAIGEPVEEATEPVAATEEAPVADAAVVAEAAPSAEVTKEEARPKPSKRTSIFGSFFEKVRSPTHEKKEADVAPAVPAKDTVASEPPVIPEPSTTETVIEAPAAPVATENALPVPEESASKSGSASPRQRESFFGNLANKVRAKSPGPASKTSEASAVPAKSEEVAAAPATEEAAATTPAAATDSTIPTVESTVEATDKSVTPKESRRKSYFGGSAIFRKASTAIRGNKESKKENVSPAVEDKVETPAIAEDEAAPQIPATEAEVKAEEPESTTDEVVPEAAPVAAEHQSSPVVSAAA